MNEQTLVDKQSVDAALKILHRLEQMRGSEYMGGFRNGYRAALEDLGLIELEKK